jgi:hypothetical protein
VDSTKNEHAGRNFGFVFGEEITIEGDLIIQADTIIEGEKFLYSGGSTPSDPSDDVYRTRIVIPQSGLDLKTGAFYSGNPHASSDVSVVTGGNYPNCTYTSVAAPTHYEAPDIYVTSPVNGSARFNIEFLGDSEDPPRQ